MGRTKPGDYADEWSPPSYTVDERSKVVGGYEPREPNNCAQDSRYEFLLVAPTLFLPGYMGSPINPIALK
jgi:hypothetical protein